MGQITYGTLPVGDRQLLEAFRTLSQSWGQDGTMRWEYSEGEPQPWHHPVSAFFDLPVVQKTAQADVYAFRMLELRFRIEGFDEFFVSFTRREEPRLQINIPARFPEDQQLEFVLSCRTVFSKFERSNLLSNLHPDVQLFYDQQRQALNELMLINSRMIKENDEHRRTQDAELAEHRQALHADFETQRKELDEVFNGKIEALAEREAELAKLKATLDDRNNTHARRDIYRNLKEQIEARSKVFKLSKETQDTRRPASVAFFALIWVTGASAVWSIFQVMQPQSTSLPEWFPLARLSLSIAAFAASIVFFIKWQDRWSSAHSDEEFRLKRLDLDVDRASWLVEMMLEWQTAKGTDLPKDLLERLAAGLFEAPSAKGSLSHPGEDAIAALLAAPASVHLKLPGGEVTLDKKSIEKLNKEKEK